MVQYAVHFSGHRIDLGNAVNLIAEEFHTVNNLSIFCRSYLERISVNAESTAV